MKQGKRRKWRRISFLLHAILLFYVIGYFFVFDKVFSHFFNRSTEDDPVLLMGRVVYMPVAWCHRAFRPQDFKPIAGFGYPQLVIVKEADDAIKPDPIQEADAWWRFLFCFDVVSEIHETESFWVSQPLLSYVGGDLIEADSASDLWDLSFEYVPNAEWFLQLEERARQAGQEALLIAETEGDEVHAALIRQMLKQLDGWQESAAEGIDTARQTR